MTAVTDQCDEKGLPGAPLIRVFCEWVGVSAIPPVAGEWRWKQLSPLSVGRAGPVRVKKGWGKMSFRLRAA